MRNTELQRKYDLKFRNKMYTKLKCTKKMSNGKCCFWVMVLWMILTLSFYTYLSFPDLSAMNIYYLDNLEKIVKGEFVKITF